MYKRQEDGITLEQLPFIDPRTGAPSAKEDFKPAEGRLSYTRSPSEARDRICRALGIGRAASPLGKKFNEVFQMGTSMDEIPNFREFLYQYILPQPELDLEALQGDRLELENLHAVLAEAQTRADALDEIVRFGREATEKQTEALVNRGAALLARAAADAGEKAVWQERVDAGRRQQETLRTRYAEAKTAEAEARRLLELLTPAEQEKMRLRDHERLKQMTFYSTTPRCLRHFILNYFGEDSPAECGKCSSCNAEMDTLDITVEAQKVISCVYRLKQRGRSGGKVLVSGILCGSESEQIKEGGYDTLSTYGIMKDVRQTYVREIIDHLELQGLLSVSDDYHTLEITPEGDEFIRSRRTLLMKRSKRAADISAVTQFSNSDGVEDPELMKRLRELRKKFADTLGVPAFVVFSDASLRDMCAKKPATKQEFLLSLIHI